MRYPDNRLKPLGENVTIGPMSTTLGGRIELALAHSGLVRSTVDTRTAAALGRAPRSLNGLTSDCISSRRQPTADVLAAMAEVMSVDPGWLLSGRGTMLSVAAATETYDSLPGWPEAADVEIRRDRVRAYVIRAAGRSPILVRPRSVDPELVYQVAMLWLSTADDAVREAAARADAEQHRS